jgi:acetyl esterase/lipase
MRARKASWGAAAVCVCCVVGLLWIKLFKATEGTPVVERLALRESDDGAAITIYHPRGAGRAAVVICPGGGYGALVLEAEGRRVAQWLNRMGMVGVVLEYRLPQGDPDRPLADAQDAIRFVRSRAAEWGVSTNQVGIIGFSAGGHLAALAATMPDAGPPPDRAAGPSSRPDFAILVYPVVSMEDLADAGSRINFLGPDPAPDRIADYSADRQVSAATPPVFLVHARDDAVVSAENSRRFHAALQAHGVACAYLELDSGGHGLGYGGPLWDQWQAQALAWLRGQGLIDPRSGGE